MSDELTYAVAGLGFLLGLTGLVLMIVTSKRL